MFRWEGYGKIYEAKLPNVKRLVDRLFVFYLWPEGWAMETSKLLWLATKLIDWR